MNHALATYLGIPKGASMSDLKNSASPRRLRALFAYLALGLLATMVSADDTILAALRQTQSPVDLAEVLNDAGLFEAPLAQRSLVCFADHLPALDVNRLLIQLHWPGPYFEGQGVGTAKLTKAPRMPWQRLGDSPGRPPVAVRFAVGDQGNVRGVWPEEETPSDVMEVIQEGMDRWRFEAAQVLGKPGTVCQRQVLVPPGLPQDPDAPPAITQDMVEAVASVEDLLEMLAETGAIQAPERIRAALCALPYDLGSPDLGPQLFAMGWPGPYSQSYFKRPAFQNPQMVKETSSQPQYTELTRKQRIMGLVQVRFFINARGQTKAFYVLESVHPDLSEVTIQAIRQTRYTPARVYDRPVSTCATKSVNFRLQ